ncbi:MAG: LegC family aminotransferase [Acidobacteria bacterium]|nr:LegC family aminotransferase [Acidobacteriota bacterium]
MPADRDIDLVASAVAAIRDVVGPREGMVALHEPCFRGREWDYVKQCLDTGWVSSVGSFVNDFERHLQDLTGATFAVATGTGSGALHVCLELAGVGRGDEVLVPALSFVATANAVAYTGAVPHFVDCEFSSLGLDPVALDSHLRDVAVPQGDGFVNRHTGRRLAAVMPVHMFGHPCQIEAIAEVAARYRMVLVEDAAESLGSSIRGRHTGTFGRLAALSFNGNKTVTTGGGGAILTSDAPLAARAKHLTTQAKVPHRWEYRHDAVGYNYRLPNLNAAVGCAQLEQLPAFLASKRRLAARYAAAFASVDGVRFVAEPTDTQSNYWLCALLLDEGLEHLLEPLLAATNDAGLMTRPAWSLLADLPMYLDAPRATLPVSTAVTRRLINMPSSPVLCLNDVDVEVGA